MMRPRAVVLILVCLVAASCVRLPQRPPLEKRLYAIDAVRPATATGATCVSQALLVRRLEVSPAAAGRELIYRTGRSTWSADYYNRFFVSPADMLTQDLRAWLVASGLFPEVLGPASLAGHGYVLEGNVTAFYGDFAADPPCAVAEMQFLLLAGSDDGRKIVLSRSYRKTSPLESGAACDVVRGLRVATGRIYADLEADLRTALTRR